MRWLTSLCLLLFMAGCSRPPADKAVTEHVPQHRKGITILVDPGHGGEDSGTKSLTTPPLYEKTYALTTALMLKKHLQHMGYKVIMTRRTDIFIPLPERSKLASAVGADLFVSVHYNAAPNLLASGIEVFFYDSKQPNARRESSRQLAEEVLGQTIGITRMPDRGVKHGNFHVVRETTMPAILVEGGFMSNDHDLARIKSPKYQNALALGIAYGVDRYLLRNRRH